ncbi:hypothetical protein IFM89_004077 [Coptis chinensis]|uniref:Aspergillus nuclease S1 n=1 Tax=Coptis chinensis TaxID=261450 RepID=A0A835H444_9MAGN|nr:hypothetical protein IFM89_004077 [Coptis chinensis]
MSIEKKGSLRGDCKDETGEKGRCVAGAINNYTNQLLTYSSSSSEYNLTEALLFLSHYIGDIHQPLHVGFTTDRGGNTIDVHWYRRKQVLHHVSIICPTIILQVIVKFKWLGKRTQRYMFNSGYHKIQLKLMRVWDANIIETSEERFYDTNVDEFIDAIQQNITGAWADEVPDWEKCSRNETTCPDIYASESIKAACAWAYKDVNEGSTLEDDYFLSRLPVVYLRLAQGGVRLAATLNRIFG